MVLQARDSRLRHGAVVKALPETHALSAGPPQRNQHGTWPSRQAFAGALRSLGFLLLVCGQMAGANQAAPDADKPAGQSAAAPAAPLAVASDSTVPKAHADFVPSAFKTFAEWKQACDRLPSNRALRGTLPPRALLPLKNFREFAEPVDAFLELAKAGELTRTNAWLGDVPTKTGFFNTASAYFLKPPLPFQPFAQRLVLPPGTRAIFHGDFHGDIHSLVAWVDWLNREGYLRDFQLARPDVYLILLGDYTDRGLYGVEVLYTILRLKLANPERVVMVRGNHEDELLAGRYGFLAEARAKFGRDFDAARVLRLYDFLPVVLYLGGETDFIQCNHGGMEPGYDPRALLAAPPDVQFQFLGWLRQRQFAESHKDWVERLDSQARDVVRKSFLDFQPQTPTTPTVLGFMWNDFTVARGEAELAIDPGRAFVYGEGTTRLLLEQASTSSRRVHAVFRAHQHANVLNPMMRRLKASRGLFRHWQTNDSTALLDANPAVLDERLEHSEERALPANSVWTFNVAPDSVYGEGCDFGFDTFGILTTAKTVEEWRLRVVNLTIVK